MKEPGKPVIHHISLMRFEPLVGRYGIHLTLPYVIHQPANMDAHGETASIGNGFYYNIKCAYVVKLTEARPASVAASEV